MDYLNTWIVWFFDVTAPNFFEERKRNCSCAFGEWHLTFRVIVILVAKTNGTENNDNDKLDCQKKGEVSPRKIQPKKVSHTCRILTVIFPRLNAIFKLSQNRPADHWISTITDQTSIPHKPQEFMSNQIKSNQSQPILKHSLNFQSRNGCGGMAAAEWLRRNGWGGIVLKISAAELRCLEKTLHSLMHVTDSQTDRL